MWGFGAIVGNDASLQTKRANLTTSINKLPIKPNIAIVTSSKSEHLKTGRFWRVTTPNGQVNFFYGTAQIPHVSITKEFATIFNSCQHFFFERYSAENSEHESFKQDAGLVLKILDNERIDDKTRNILSRYFPPAQDVLNKAIENVECLFTFTNLLHKLPCKWKELIGGLAPDDQALLAQPLYHWSASVDVISYECINNFNAKLFLEAFFLKQIDSSVSIKRLEDVWSISECSRKLQANITEQSVLHDFTNYKNNIKPNPQLPTLSTKMDKNCSLHYLLYMQIDFSQLENPELSDSFELLTYSFDKYRAKQMMERVLPELEQGSCMVMVNLGHFFGKSGILENLLENGYVVERIFETPNTKSLSFLYDKYKNHNVLEEVYKFNTPPGFTSQWVKDNEQRYYPDGTPGGNLDIRHPTVQYRL